MSSYGEQTNRTLAHPVEDTGKQCPPSLLRPSESKRALWAQCWMIMAVVVVVTAAGMPTGFSAILLPQLQSRESVLPTDDEQASWIASVHSVMTPVGSLLVGPLMDRLGRRTCLQLSILPLLVGWLCMAFAPDHAYLLAGRMIAGFAVGMIPGTAQVLVGEIAEPRLREVFSSIPNLAYCLGILLVNILGCWLPWTFVAVLSTVVPICGMLMMFTLPESPVWLINRGRTDKARRSLMYLRGGDSTKVNEEIHLMVVHYKASQEKTIQDSEVVTCIPAKITNLLQPEVYKPFCIIFFFCLLQVLSGSYIVIFYSVPLISSTSGGRDCDKEIGVMTAAVRFFITIVTTVSLMKLGRRKIGIFSGVGTALSCFLLVAYLQLKHHYLSLELDSALDLTIIAILILLYVAFNTFGIFGLPFMMIGEILPTRIRGVVTGVLICSINIVTFATTKLYPHAAAVLGPDGVFLAFGLVATLTTVYIYLFLPETRDSPLTQIEQYFALGKNFLWVKRDRNLLPKATSSTKL